MARRRTGLALRAALAGLLAFVPAMPGAVLSAQNVAGTDPYTNEVIETVQIRIANPSQDEALNDRIEDGVRRAVSVFPGERFSQQKLDFQLAQARRIRDVGGLKYDIEPAATGGLNIIVEVTIGETAAPEGRGMAFGGKFPTLYEKDGTYVRFKLDLFGLYYSNNNAWYGEPDQLLAGNPLVAGEPAGEGYDDWVEAYAHYGIYGITPLNEGTYVYAGVSAITAASVGQELFSDESRSFTGIEDAYVGIVGGNTDEDGNRFSYNVTAGRQRFTLANGFLIANTAANGSDRAALQANARWASDFLGLARLRWNNTMLEVFYLDPDELPIVDSRTSYAGVNLEFQPSANLTVGTSFVTSPESDFNYFSPVGGIAGTREGLRVYDARFNYVPNGPGAQGPFFGGEIAFQDNANFDMSAHAGWAEVGYSFPRAKWSPAISYRVSKFSGDDPDTATFERWDPMLSGGTGEQWVQGANHFKVVQNSNVIAHRIQGRLRPMRMIELVPQLWAFRADSLNNIGGNPALTFLSDKEYGYEANMTAKWFASRNLYVHGHVAYTWPGDAVEAALAGAEKGWLSTMLFVRYAF
ncbi:alginate export family protein [Erythrobacter sp.]|uniref:alginate export family protein n=1 Tax=Erythrobacter sp. TaxID=1042 RepID=UPI001425BBDE|nr:alginate export family protein [Erythrobacter sp.]QIQ86384.1 MAG: alginate export family protein [Erythrobacter sp.]